MNNLECRIRPQIVNINSKESIFFPFNINTNKCSGSCNNINNPHAKLRVPDIVKNLNVKVMLFNVMLFNLMSITNEARHIEWYETCKRKCRLDSSVCNKKQRCIEDKCKCECK